MEFNRTPIEEFASWEKALFDAQCLKLLGPYQKDRIREGTRLAEYLIDAIGEENAKKFFCFQDDFSKHLMLDELKYQYKCYPLKKLWDDFHKLATTEDKKRSRPLHSYWKEAYGQFQIDVNHDEKEYMESMSIGIRYHCRN